MRGFLYEEVPRKNAKARQRNDLTSVKLRAAQHIYRAGIFLPVLLLKLRSGLSDRVCRALGPAIESNAFIGVIRLFPRAFCFHNGRVRSALLRVRVNGLRLCVACISARGFETPACGGIHASLHGNNQHRSLLFSLAGITDDKFPVMHLAVETIFPALPVQKTEITVTALVLPLKAAGVAVVLKLKIMLLRNLAGNSPEGRVLPGTALPAIPEACRHGRSQSLDTDLRGWSGVLYLINRELSA